MPEISIIIDNYNYGQYIGDAIRSVLVQDYSVFELIIVDDGSTDNSREVISSFTDSRIKKIFKENGGQLSAFNEGFKAASGKIICFLDSDDLYQQGYLSTVAEQFSRYPDCECLLGRVEYFGKRSGLAPFFPDGFLGCNPFSVATRHVWKGTPTSACSVKRESLAKILPYIENEKYWKTRADDLLIWGTDLVGAKKYCFSSPTVKYRIHGNNLFCGSPDFSHGQYLQRKQAAEQFCKAIIEKNQLNLLEMFKTENVYGNLPSKEKILSWLKAGKARMLSLSQWCICGFILIHGAFRKK
ncbi:MAG: glycosyltransferase [Lentisphaeria bacterium]|nr:glycosyltransferase [Lentisphaeria bacterium]